MKTNKRNYILGVMLTIVIIIAVVLAAVTAKNSTPLKGNEEYAVGIDVSSHNGEIDWKTVAENTEFAIIRAGTEATARQAQLLRTNFLPKI